MKIYVDQTPPYQSTPEEECQGECRECSASLDSLPSIFPLTPHEQQQVQLLKLQHAPLLYRQQITQERWLLCNPGGAGHVLVLDTEACALFERFHLPQTLTDINDMRRSIAELAQIITVFVKSGLLVDATTGATAPFRQEDASVLTAWLHVTNSCNLRCSYCYVEKSQESMSYDTAYQSIDAIFRTAIKHHFSHIKLKYAGGEASLHLPHVIKMHDYALELAQRHHIALGACILSNGVYLSSQAIADLKRRAIGITLSLDGIGIYQDRQRTFKNGFGSFRYVDRTLQKLLQHEIVPTISITVSQRNIAGLPELISYLLDRGLPFLLNYYRENPQSAHLADLSFSEQQMIQGMQDVFQVLAKRLPRHRLLESILDKANLVQPHQHTCGVGRNYLVIDQRGGITKCQTTLQQSITTIDADDPLQALRDDRAGLLSVPVEEKEGCQQCHWRYWCAGGCPALTYQATGRYDVKSPNCHIYQALFPAALYLEAQRLLTYQIPLSFEHTSIEIGRV